MKFCDVIAGNPAIHAEQDVQRFTVAVPLDTEPPGGLHDRQKLMRVGMSRRNRI